MTCLSVSLSLYSLNLPHYILRRILQAIPLLLGALAINFLLIHLAPGDPIYLLAGDGGDERYYAEMRARFGLDQPIQNQMGLYFFNAAQGEFGYSYVYNQPVFQVISARLPPTLLLLLPAFLLSTGIAIVLGMLAARRAHSPIDHAIAVITLIGYGMPAFWLGQLLVLGFAVTVRWFPVQGMTDVRQSYEGLAYWLDVLRHLVLPMLTLGLLNLALVTRLTRTGLREELAEEYVRTAYAKGLRESYVLERHALRNALLPVVTAIGNYIPTLFTGAVLTEIIFAWPGLGRLLYDATLARDYPLLMGIFIFVAACVILSNLLTDIAYTFLDPRVRLH